MDHGEIEGYFPMLLDVDGVGLVCEPCWKLGADMSIVLGMDDDYKDLPNSVWMNIKAFLGP